MMIKKFIHKQKWQKMALALSVLILLYAGYQSIKLTNHFRGFTWDTYTQDIPWQMYAVNRLKNGEIPWWNPFEGFGTPFLGIQQHRFFHPFRFVLNLFLEPSTSYLPEVYLHILIVLLGFIILFRFFGIEKWLTYLTAIPATQFFLLPISISHPSELMTSAYYPLVLALALYFLKEARLFYALALALSVALAYYAGHAQYFFYICQMTLVWMIAFLANQAISQKAFLTQRHLIYGGIALLFLIALFMGQFYPTWEMSQDAVRLQKGLTFEQVTRWISPRPFILSQIFSFLPIPASEYALAAILLFFFLVVLKIKKQFRVFLAGVFAYALFSYLLSYNSFEILQKWNYQFHPAGPLFRINQRMAIGVMPISIALCVALILDRIWTANKLKLPVMGKTLPLLKTTVFLFFLLFIGNIHIEVRTPTAIQYTHAIQRYKVTIEHILPSLQPYDRSLIYLDPFFPSIFPSLNISTASGILNNIRFYRSNASYRVFHFFNQISPSMQESSDIWIGAALGFQSEKFTQKTPVHFECLRLTGTKYFIITDLLLRRLKAFNLHKKLHLKQIAHFSNDIRSDTMLTLEADNISAQEYEMLFEIFSKRLGKTLKREDDYSTTFFLIEGALPRAFFYPIKNPSRLIEKNNFPLSCNVQKESVLPAQIVEYKPEKVKIQLSVKRTGVLVLSDLYDPNWRAYVIINNKRRNLPLFAVHNVFRGVSLKAGEHTIVFEYQTKKYLTAILTSLGSLLLLLALLLFTQIKKI